VPGRSFRTFAGLVDAASASGLARAVGATWPPPPALSVRALLNLALARSGLVKHVFVLVLENRSFDHMLGASTGTIEPDGTIQPGTGTEATTGAPTTVNAAIGQANVSNGQTFRIRAGAPFVMPVDPPHEFCDVQAQLAGAGITGNPGDDTCAYSGAYPPITLAGFVDSYARQAAVEAASPDSGTQQAGQTALADLGSVMACLTGAQVPVLSTLAAQFAICDQWYSALPGPTWPNRFFLHAASSGGLDHSPSSWDAGTSYLDGYQFAKGTIFNALDAHNVSWRVYHGDDLPQVLALHGMDLFTVAEHFHDLNDLANDLQDPGFSAQYVFIEPNYGHVLTDGGDFQCGNSQHPIDDVTRGEALIKYVYEAIRAAPCWASSLLLITYDEHGGFYDHVPPPPAVPPGDAAQPGNNVHGFLFDQQGVRVPAVAVSPLIPANIIDHTRYDHSSLLATVERLFGLQPLTARDEQANDLLHLLLVPPRQDAPVTLPAPAVSGFNCGSGPLDAPASSTIEPVAKSIQPITTTLRGFLEVAAIMDLRLHPEERARVTSQLQTIRTLGQASKYLIQVANQLRAARRV
jgi:phospholipase C